MTAQDWEQGLLLLTRETSPRSFQSRVRVDNDPYSMERAFAFCDALTASSSRTFHLATRFLPKEKRQAIRALYAFCRVSDNLIDCPERHSEQAWLVWRRKALVPEAEDFKDPVLNAWNATCCRYQIPIRYVEQLLDGIGYDLQQRRYTSFAELTGYAYRVASTVGLMSMYIIGYSSEAAVPYAVKLGVALQLTNLLRDVGEDWRAGRVYLPLDELAEYGLAVQDLERGQVDERWRAFMRFQIERNRILYQEAFPGIAYLEKQGRLAVAAAAELYRGILDDIQAHDFDVFHRRAHLSMFEKFLRLPYIYYKSLRHENI